MKTMFFYGLLGAEGQYRCVRYDFLTEEDKVTVKLMKFIAQKLKYDYPSIESIYVVDNRYGLNRDFMEAFKKPTIENCYAFKDLLEREGIKIL